MWAGFGVIIVAGMIYGAKKLNDYVVNRPDKADSPIHSVPQKGTVADKERYIEKLKSEFNCDVDCDEVTFLTKDCSTEFTVNGHSYFGYESLSHLEHNAKEKPQHLKCDKLTLCTDKYGRRVVVLSKDIPCFDSGDRMYDSSRRVYFFHDGKFTHALYVGEGYRVSSLVLYKNVKAKSPYLKTFLSQKGFPNI